MSSTVCFCVPHQLGSPDRHARAQPTEESQYKKISTTTAQTENPGSRTPVLARTCWQDNGKSKRPHIMLESRRTHRATKNKNKQNNYKMIVHKPRWTKGTDSKTFPFRRQFGAQTYPPQSASNHTDSACNPPNPRFPAFLANCVVDNPGHNRFAKRKLLFELHVMRPTLSMINVRSAGSMASWLAWKAVRRPGAKWKLSVVNLV